MVTPESGQHDLRLDSFSGRLGPVYVKELRQGLRARRFVVPFLTIHAMAIVTIATQFAVKHYATGTGIPHDFIDWLRFGAIDYLLFILLWLMVGLIMPLTGINALQEELGEKRNIELLLLARLNRWQIVRSKWLVLCTLSGLILVSMLPYILTLYFSGGIDLIANLGQLVALGLFNVVMSAFMIGASAYQNLLGRLILVGMIFLSYMFVSVYNLSSIGASSASGWGAIQTIGYGTNYLLVVTLYVIYGMQLGRSKLRLYEDPVDPPVTGLIIAMIIFTPVITGIFRVAGGLLGSIIVLAGLIALSLSIDRGPGAEGNTPYAQP